MYRPWSGRDTGKVFMLLRLKSTRRCAAVAAVIWSLHPLGVLAQESPDAPGVINAPRVILGGVPFTLELQGDAGAALDYEVRNAQGTVLGSGSVAAGGTARVDGLVVSTRNGLPLTVQLGQVSEELSRPFAPGWFSLAPPVLAIVLALLFKEVITALLAGVWLGALAVAGYNPLSAAWRTIDLYAVSAIADVDGGHTQIIVFSLLLGGLVGIVSRNGGTQGIVDAVSPFASTSRRGKIATWIAGLAIFFDDYANTLIVGNTMRPITDRLKISREKLAYIVDSTAAPVAALVPISTWVGYEISLIADGMSIAAQQPGVDPALVATLTSISPFAVFISTIPYRFYALLALAFVLLTSVMNRDFGPMAAAERRAASDGGVHRAGAQLAVDTTDLQMTPPGGGDASMVQCGGADHRRHPGRPRGPLYVWTCVSGCGRILDGRLRRGRPLYDTSLGIRGGMYRGNGTFGGAADLDRPGVAERMVSRHEGDVPGDGHTDAGMVPRPSDRGSGYGSVRRTDPERLAAT